MNGVLVTASVAPLLADPRLAAAQVSQLVLGEGAEVLESSGAMLRVRTLLDHYSGWIHSGYTSRFPLGEVEAWLANAAWSEGAVVECRDGVLLRAPHRARLIDEGRGRVRLPGGLVADVIDGEVHAYGEVMTRAQGHPPAEWAWREFAGSPYLWGGVTAAGFDCSGLVQTTFVMRGITLPRDARQQVGYGQAIETGERRAGDLLFFRDAQGSEVSHVAMLAGHETIVHATVETGCVTRESWADGTRAEPLRERLVAVRRLS